jgi:hypothetical protein
MKKNLFWTSLKKARDKYQDMSTADLIATHLRYRRQMQAILSGEIKRGEDFWGGYDDAIANSLDLTQLALGYRALVQYDMDALDVLDANDWRTVASELLNIVRNAIHHETVEYIEWLRYVADEGDE